jgi:hypothetical protein
MRMKRKIFFIIVFLVLIAAIVSSVEPVIILFAKKQIRNMFIGSAVSIKGCQLNLFNRLTLRDITIKDPARYDLKFGEISAEYSLWSILKRNILKVSLKDAVADINLTQQDLLDLNRALGSQSPGAMLSIQTLQLSNLTFHVRAAAARLEVRLSAELNLKKSALDSLDLKISSFSWRDFTLEEAAVRLGPPQPGDFFIQKIQYGKVKVTDVKAKVAPQEKGLLVDSLSAQILNGTLAGSLSFKIDEPLKYFARVIFTNLDLAEVVQAFDLKKEVQMSGRVSGKMTVTGRGADIHILDGDFSAVDPGGLLEIKNEEFLKNIARNSQQPLDIVIASFKDYHYNVGALRVALEKSDLVFDAALDGETGKRNINITLHDFLLRKE